MSCDFRIGRFRNDESDLITQDVVEGNILQMVNHIIELLRSKYLLSPIHYEGITRIEQLEIPEDVLREAICNAILCKCLHKIQLQIASRNTSSGISNCPIRVIPS